ncbi:MAG: adenylate/guanylate cyclase domain-containing protein, partial [Desulfobulbaceae bacterium]|nr:adenylate/guanylate cyclase domain-containing protein [Desulfobulbaceae bacterium]
VLFWLNQHLQEPAAAAPVSPSVVVAIDEATYRTPPFAGTPKVFWTDRIARVVDGLCDAGAAVVAFDVVFSTSVEPFLPGYERPLLLSLRKASRNHQLVLGMVQHSVKPIAPAPAQSFAVGHGANIRSLNLILDGDGIVRNHPLFFKSASLNGEVANVPSMALELAARKRGAGVRFLADGRSALGDMVVDGSQDGRILLNFSAVDAIPSYSLVNVFADVEAGRSELLAARFAGKVVFIGSVLDVEDRWFTSTRLVPLSVGVDSSSGGGEAGARSGGRDFRRENMPGVFIHATAVNNLLQGTQLRMLEPAWRSGVVGSLVAMVFAVTMFLPVAWAAVAFGVIAALLTGLSFFLFGENIVLPVLTSAFAGGVAFAVALGYRFILFDRQKWRIRRLFALYTSPTMLDRMLKSNQLPELGGEERQVTVWFSDLAGFTALSEGMTPAAVVSMMNSYLTAITEVIEEYGGFVDKYIGDAVVAVFGAPHDDPEHPVNAVRAALAVRAKLLRLHAEGCFGQHQPLTRIGISSGLAMVGNIGSRQRFNYTVMGDTVNLASRLEGANKSLGTDILLAESTVTMLPASMVVREVDRIRAKGRQASVRVFEPLALAREEVSVEQRTALAVYEEALGLLREGEPERAAEALSDIAGDDSVAAALKGRAEEQALSGEPYEQGVLVLRQK